MGRAIATSLACSLGGVLLASSASLAAVLHTVLPGETLWSISTASNLTTRTVAIYNGLPEDALLVAGATVFVPTVQEGAAALASGAPAVAPVPSAGLSPGASDPATESSTTSTATVAPAPGMGHVHSPYGTTAVRELGWRRVSQAIRELLSSPRGRRRARRSPAARRARR